MMNDQNHSALFPDTSALLEKDDIFFSEETASDDIQTLVRFDCGQLYTTDRFKVRGRSLKVMTPKFSFGANRSLIHRADVIRNKLSVHPSKEDLLNIDTIIVRPRHIESGGIELTALYLRDMKYLVLYLFCPHVYSQSHAAARYGEFFDAAQDVSPLSYFLSMAEPFPRGEIDSFYFKTGSAHSPLLSKLDEISAQYKTHGY